MSESEKMLQIIHENRKRVYKNNLKHEKKENKRNILIIAIALITAAAVIYLGVRYNERQVSSCMEAGGSENYCRYAGE